MNVDAPGLLLGALLGAEVAAVGLAVRSFGFDQGVADHLRKLVSMLRKAAQKLTRAGDVAVVERAANVKHDGFEVGGHTGSIGGASESRQRNRTLLALLAFALVDEVVLALLHAFLFEGAPRPLAGWARLGWHVETLFVLGWPAALAWTCGFGRQTTKLQKSSILQFGGSWLPGLYLGAVAFLVLAYPPPRAFLRWFYLAWEVLCVALAWRGLWRGRRRAWGPADVALVALVSCETMVALVGPFASDPFARWWIARAFYLGAWVAVCGVLIKRRG